MNRDREHQVDPGDIDNAITIWVFLGSVLLAIAAYVLYQSGQVAIGIALGVISFIGINIPTVGYSLWRKHRRATKLKDHSGSKEGNGAI